MKRKVAPDSPQSMGFFAPLSGDAPSMVQQFSVAWTFAPKALTARNVASVSSEIRGFESLETPFESAAAISIRWV
jgi:hypothetical protein